MWQVVLKDGTSFLGKKTFKASWWYDDLFNRAYVVAGTSSPALPVGVVIVVPLRSILYRYKVSRK